MRLYQVGNRFKSCVGSLSPLTRAIAVLLFLPLSISCGPVMTASPVPSDDLDRESLRIAVQRSISYLEKLPPDRIVGEQPRPFTAKEILNGLREFERLLPQWDCRACWLDEFNARFELVPSSDEPKTQTILFTGYYQPVIEASLVPTAEFAYPIYGKPADLIVAEQVTLIPGVTKEKVIGRVQGENWLPYYSRREIDEEGALRGRDSEIAWVKDPIELFFLHIQGSGLLRLPDGQQLQIGYAAANGRPYRSIGRLLIDRGKVSQEEMSMQRLRLYLTEHPEERSEIFAYNESYVFFRLVPEGPLGSLDFPVTPERSIATDARLFPKGALAFIITQRPIIDAAGQLSGWQPFSRFVLNQDTGGAIRGPQRVDLYFGTGDGAGAAAGVMNRQGKLYFLSLKRRSVSVAGEK
jgi:membrane-bound lytic murein transglycosylase A